MTTWRLATISVVVIVADICVGVFFNAGPQRLFHLRS